jgi:hypothetical protein
VEDVSEGREDWREVFERLKAERFVRQQAGADRMRAVLDRIARWTGDTAP